MARTVTIATTGAVTANSATPSSPSVVVGAAPQWADGSDGTYVEIRGVYQNTTGISGSGAASLTTGIGVALSPAVTVAARMRLSSPDGKPLPSVAVLRPDGSAYIAGSSPDVTPTGASWVSLPLTGDVAGFLFDVKSGNPLSVQVESPLGFPFPSSATTYLWTVYELELVVTLPSTDAPPCRIFPRSDGLGVGAGRAFPPPRSQQRSPGNRGVGYY